MKEKRQGNNEKVIGRIHSIETCGTVDGPGIRFVVFLQGCPLRCIYCHNPDTRPFGGGRQISVLALVNEIKRYKPYMLFSGGGVTVSGGEPLAQPVFVAELFKACRKLDIHTALDTSGFGNQEAAIPLVDETDLVLLDIKSYDKDQYKKITQTPLEPTLKFLEYLDIKQKPIWVRYVLVPGWTDDPETIQKMAEYLRPFKTIERIQILPFHKLGEYKWQEMGYPYMLESVKEPSQELLQTVKEIFQAQGFIVE